jgi:hypothetical protein
VPLQLLSKLVRCNLGLLLFRYMLVTKAKRHPSVLFTLVSKVINHAQGKYSSLGVDYAKSIIHGLLISNQADGKLTSCHAFLQVF